LRIAVLFALAALAGAGCRNESSILSGPPPVDTTTPVPVRLLTAVAGDGQSGIVGRQLSSPLEVAVRDAAGRGVAGVLVQFAVVGTNAALTPRMGMVLTDSAGHAPVTVTFGTSAGAVRVVAASADAAGAVTFNLVATPSPALMLVAVSGDSQVVALPGSDLEPLLVAVRDTFGNRVSARPAVVFRVIAGGATYGGRDSVPVATDSTGAASAALTSPAPADGDTVRVTARFAGMAKPPLRAIVVGLAFRGKTWGAYWSRVCAATVGGTAYCWGNNEYGSLGTGDATSRNAPAPVATTASFVAADAGGGAGCGLTPGGAAVCWGSTSFGAPGGGSVPFRSLNVAGGLACGVSGSGALHCWGAYPLPYTTPRMVVPSPVRLAVVSAGGSVACALSADGRAFCWGDNYDGQLGTGTSASSTSNLLPVAGSLTFRSISVGEHHVCGLTAAGAAYCWGLNYYGALGNGTTANALAPVPVAGGLTFADVSAGAMHTCAVTAAGAAYCWGYNGNGQLGNGTTSDSPLTTPTPVTGGITFASVSAGEGFTCGIAVGGAMYCWGSNGYGQLGTGVFGGPSVTAPMPVTGGLLFRP
jgi:hypothetical protein